MWIVNYLKGLLEELLKAIRPAGPSTTKIIYLSTGWAGLLAALMLTGAFCWVYVRDRTADPAFAGAVSGLWLVAYGFVSTVQNKKNDADKEIALKEKPDADPAT